MDDDFQDFENWRKKKKLKPMTSWQSYIRYIGLRAYAVAIVLGAMAVWVTFDTIKSHGIDGLKEATRPLGIIASSAVVFFAVGFTTGRRPAD
jgi:hypothetical protein